MNPGLEALNKEQIISTRHSIFGRSIIGRAGNGRIMGGLTSIPKQKWGAVHGRRGGLSCAHCTREPITLSSLRVCKLDELATAMFPAPESNNSCNNVPHPPNVSINFRRASSSRRCSLAFCFYCFFFLNYTPLCLLVLPWKISSLASFFTSITSTDFHFFLLFVSPQLHQVLNH